VALLHHGRAGDNFVVAEDTPVSVPAFYEAYACAIGRGRVLRRPWAEFSAGRDTDWLEVARTSQPVDAARFKARTGWRARETFATTVPRLLAGNGPGTGEG
jgi:nucleoside-diphosphate-sugar epimerase